MADGRVSLDDLTETLIRAAARGIRVAIPACVLSVNNDAGTVGVRLEFRRPRTDPDDEADTDPNLADVPVMFPSSAAVEMSYQINKDDRGLVLFADYAIGTWRDNGTIIDPGPGEAHGLSGAVFLPGLWPLGKQVTIPAAGAIIGMRGGERIEIVPGEVRAGKGASDLAIKADYLDDEDAFLKALNTYLTAENLWTTALGGLPGMAVPAATFQGAITALKAAITLFRNVAPTQKTTVTRVK